jgi:peptide/nickel transport system substrate-binding protein
VISSVVIVVAVLALGSCGSDENEDTSSAAGGSVTAAQGAQPGPLDPALSYDAGGWEPMWIVYTPLLTYRHEEGPPGAELIPGLAEDLPRISGDGRRYTLTLRDGLEYSDGTPVVASDFEHTIKRVLNLESPGSSFYLGIAGAEDFVAGNDHEADIEGISTNDDTGEIVIELVEANATFSNILAMNFAGLVPGDTPFRNLTDDPPAGVGPYEITESAPNRQWRSRRSRQANWTRSRP